MNPPLRSSPEPVPGCQLPSLALPHSFKFPHGCGVGERSTRSSRSVSRRSPITLICASPVASGFPETFWRCCTCKRDDGDDMDRGHFWLPFVYGSRSRCITLFRKSSKIRSAPGTGAKLCFEHCLKQDFGGKLHVQTTCALTRYVRRCCDSLGRTDPQLVITWGSSPNWIGRLDYGADPLVYSPGFLETPLLGRERLVDREPSAC